MHLANGDIDVTYGQLPPGQEDSVDATVKLMVEMARGKWGARSPKIRALAINIINTAKVPDKDYYGMIEAIHNYVRDQIRYVRDVVGQETLSYPEETLFNSRGEDCDGKTIAEMALLGSIGIRSYPVVIGLEPGRYSHVYLHAEVPAGRGRYAGQTIAADPIMREWPLGKAAPDAKVKMKKTYPHLAGLGAMALHGYARSPAYFSPLDELEATQVPGVLKRRMTDTGSRGTIITTKRLLEHGDELDDMFNRAMTLNPMQAAPAFELYNRGPVTNRGEKILTSYLSQAVPAKRISAPLDRPVRRGPKIVTVNEQPRRMRKVTPVPSVGELLGLSDYLSDLATIAKPAGQRNLVAGKADPLHRAAAAVVHAKSRARKASGKVVRMEKGDGFLFGLGDVSPAVFNSHLHRARHVERLAHQISAKAQAIANMCAGDSPVRQHALRMDVGALEHMDTHLGVVDAVIECEANGNPYQDAEDKVNTLTAVAADPDFRAASTHKARPALPAQPVKPIVGVLPAGAVVRNQNGEAIFADNGGADEGLADLGRFSLRRAVQNIVRAPQRAVQAVHAQVKKAGQQVQKDMRKAGQQVRAVAKNKRLRKLALGVATGGASLLTEKTIHRPLQKLMAKRGDKSVVAPEGAPAPDAPAEDASVTPQPGENTYDGGGSSGAEPIDQNYGPEDIGPAEESESAVADESRAASGGPSGDGGGGGGGGGSFTNTRDVEEGVNPFEQESAAPSDDASEGSVPAPEDEQSFSEETPVPARRRRAISRATEDLDDAPGDRYDAEDAESEDEEEIPSVDGLPTLAGASVGTLALVGVGLFLLLRKKK